MLRGILFDFNGVLIDDEPLHFELFRQVLAEEGVALDEETYYRDYVGFDDATGFRYALPQAEPATVVRLCARKATYYRERIKAGRYPFFAGAVDLVRQAAASGQVLGIVSGALRSEIEPALRQEGIDQLFKVVVAAEDVERSKPDPEGYRRGVHELNSQPPLPARLFHPHEILAIEDTPVLDELAARPIAGAGHLQDPCVVNASELDGTHGHLVFGERPGLVGADHVHLAERFHCG